MTAAGRDSRALLPYVVAAVVALLVGVAATAISSVPVTAAVIAPVLLLAIGLYKMRSR